MTEVLSNLSAFAEWTWGQLAELMTQIQSNPILFIIIFGLGLVGYVCGILRRLVRL